MRQAHFCQWIFRASVVSKNRTSVFENRCWLFYFGTVLLFIHLYLSNILSLKINFVVVVSRDTKGSWRHRGLHHAPTGQPSLLWVAIYFMIKFLKKFQPIFCLDLKILENQILDVKSLKFFDDISAEFRDFFKFQVCSK